MVKFIANAYKTKSSKKVVTQEDPNCTSCQVKRGVDADLKYTSYYPSDIKNYGPASTITTTATTALTHEPLNKEVLGKSSWTFLHATAAQYPVFPTDRDKFVMKSLLDSIGYFYPCEMCRVHFRDYMLTTPPDLTSRTSVATWLCEIHNNVNRRIGKPVFDCTTCIDRWTVR